MSGGWSSPYEHRSFFELSKIAACPPRSAVPGFKRLAPRRISSGAATSIAGHLLRSAMESFFFPRKREIFVFAGRVNGMNISFRGGSHFSSRASTFKFMMIHYCNFLTGNCTRRNISPRKSFRDTYDSHLPTTFYNYFQFKQQSLFIMCSQTS